MGFQEFLGKGCIVGKINIIVSHKHLFCTILEVISLVSTFWHRALCVFKGYPSVMAAYFGAPKQDIFREKGANVPKEAYCHEQKPNRHVK